MKKTPHQHAALIHAFADGGKIEMYTSHNGWIEVPNPDWTAPQYRLKPRKEYPASTLSYNELSDIVNAAHKIPGGEGHQTKIARLAADAAVAEFIESGAMDAYIASEKR